LYGKRRNYFRPPELAELPVSPTNTTIARTNNTPLVASKEIAPYFNYSSSPDILRIIKI